MISGQKNQSGQGLLEVIVTIAIASLIVIALVALANRSLGSADSSKNEETARNFASQWIELIKGIKAGAIPGSVNHYCVDNAAPASPNISGCSSAGVVRTTACCGSTQTGRTFADIFQYNFDELDAAGAHTEDLGYILHLHTNLDAYNTPVYNGSGGPYDPGVGDCSLSPQGWCMDFHNSFTTVRLNQVDYTIGVYLADTPFGASGYSRCNVTAADYTKIKQFTVEVSWTDRTGYHEINSVACLTR